MLEPKFIAYLSDKKDKTKHGYEYIVLKPDTPENLIYEYMSFVNEQDKRCEKGEFIVRL